jgi:hypothetical protein
MHVSAYTFVGEDKKFVLLAMESVLFLPQKVINKGMHKLLRLPHIMASDDNVTGISIQHLRYRPSPLLFLRIYIQQHSRSIFHQQRMLTKAFKCLDIIKATMK